MAEKSTLSELVRVIDHFQLSWVDVDGAPYLNVFKQKTRIGTSFKEASFVLDIELLQNRITISIVSSFTK